jgi:hypothetical protein
MAEKSDQALLTALLDVRHLLNEKEALAFSDMLDKMQSSNKGLSKDQRAWAEKRYRELNLGAAPKPKDITVKPGEKFPYELLPRPLKPPTRK